MTPQPPSPPSNAGRLANWLFLLGTLAIINSLTLSSLQLRQPAFPAAWRTLPLLISVALAAIGGWWLYLYYRHREIRLPNHPLALPVAGVVLCLLLTASTAFGVSTLMNLAGRGKPGVYAVVALALVSLPPGLFWCWKLNLRTLREALSQNRKAE